MRYIVLVLMSFFLFGCASKATKGEYVIYESKEYLFIHDKFINQNLECLELGEMKQGGLDVKYCVGENYASALVQGFIFEHKYSSFNERFVGATLSFKTEDVFTIQCSSETINDAPSGKEYIDCMVPKREFDIFSFIINSKSDINGEFRAAVGDKKVFHGVIKSEGKELLKVFYKAIIDKDRQKWSKRKL